MADHYHLLPLILSLSLLILPSSSHAETQAMFSEPLQILFGGQNLTDGDLTLSLSNDCGLILYNKDGIPVLDFNTSTTTKHCAFLLNKYGRPILVPDNEQTITQAIGKKTSSGSYALLFVDGKLGIFGPAIWNNGVSLSTLFNINEPTRGLNHGKLKTGLADYILFSGNTATGSANGDVIIAQNGKVSTVITNKCALAVKDGTTNKTIWHSWPTSAEPTQCFLEFSSHGELSLKGYNESGVYTQWKGGYSAREKLYVFLLRYFGRMTIYGLKTWLYDGSSSTAGAASIVVAENIEMVTI